MNLGKETETLEFKKSTGELSESPIFIQFIPLGASVMKSFIGLGEPPRATSHT